jgi:hypothetical protein
MGLQQGCSTSLIGNTCSRDPQERELVAFRSRSHSPDVPVHVAGVRPLVETITAKLE